MTLRHIAARTVQVAVLAAGILGLFLLLSRQAYAATTGPSADAIGLSPTVHAHITHPAPKAVGTASDRTASDRTAYDRTAARPVTRATVTRTRADVGGLPRPARPGRPGRASEPRVEPARGGPLATAGPGRGHRADDHLRWRERREARFGLGQRLSSGPHLGPGSTHHHEHRELRATRGAVTGHGHAGPGLAKPKAPGLAKHAGPPGLAKPAGPPGLAKKVTAGRTIAAPGWPGASIQVASSYTAPSYTAPPHNRGVRCAPVSPKPSPLPRGPAVASCVLNHAGGGTTESARGDGTGGNNALASADAMKPARLTPVLTRLARDAAAKPVWRAYLPEVPPA